MSSFAIRAVVGPMLVAAVFSTFAPWATAELQFPLTAPKPKIGDLAKFRTIDLWNNKELFTSENEVVEVRDDRWLVRAKSSNNPDARTFTFTSDLHPCRSMRNSDVVVCGGSLKFPMQIGNKHNYEKLPWPNGAGQSSGNCEVKGEEKLTIPMGAIDAVRIDCVGFWNRVFDGSGTGRQSESLWYAPSVGRVVRTLFTDAYANGMANTKTQTEMVEFVPAK